MAELKLNIIVDNINKLKRQLENISIGSKQDSGGRGGGGASALGIGASVALLTELVRNSESIQALLRIISSLVDRLVSPFVPILLTIIKPVLLLLETFLSKALQGFGAFGGVDMSGLEEAVKGFISGFAGALALITALLAGLSVGWAAAIGAAILLLVPIMVDFGKELANKLISVGGKIGDFLANGLASVAQLIFDTFGIDLLTPLKQYFNGILDIFSGLSDILFGIFDLDLGQIKEGFNKVFSGIAETLKGLFNIYWAILSRIIEGAWTGLKNIWQSLLSSMKSIVSSFADLFIKGLNGLIELINYVPGIELDRIRATGSNVSRSINTEINVNIEGSADENTVQSVVDRLRSELNRRGAF